MDVAIYKQHETCDVTSSNVFRRYVVQRWGIGGFSFRVKKYGHVWAWLHVQKDLVWPFSPKSDLQREFIMYMYWIHVHLPQLCCPVDPKGCHPSQWPMSAMLRGSPLAYVGICWNTWWHSGHGILHGFPLRGSSFSIVSAWITLAQFGHFPGNSHSLLGSQNHESSENLHMCTG